MRAFDICGETSIMYIVCGKWHWSLLVTSRTDPFWLPSFLIYRMGECESVVLDACTFARVYSWIRADHCRLWQHRMPPDETQPIFEWQWFSSCQAHSMSINLFHFSFDTNTAVGAFDIWSTKKFCDRTKRNVKAVECTTMVSETKNISIKHEKSSLVCFDFCPTFAISSMKIACYRRNLYLLFVDVQARIDSIFLHTSEIIQQFKTIMVRSMHMDYIYAPSYYSTRAHTYR